MKALVAQELSGPSGLVYTDVDDVDNDEMVVVDVGAAGVSFPDLLLLRGEYQLRLEPPFIPGMEVAGVVRSAPDESEFRPGQRVTALTMLGGWAEQVAVPPANLTPTPDDLDDAEAVALLGNYQTMYFALARRGALRHGETVLVLGSGRWHRHRRHPDRKGTGRQGDRAGASPAGDASSWSRWAPTWCCRSPTAGCRRSRTTPAAAVSTSWWTRSAARRSTTRSARWPPRAGCWCIGFASGGGIPTVKVNRLLLRNVCVVGVGYGEFVNRTPGAQSLFGFGVANWSKAGLRPPPPVRFPLSKGADALQSLADGGVLGKVVLEP